MNILVLGAAGFAGSALCRALLKCGYTVFDADNRANAAYKFDLSDRKSIDELMIKSSPQVIIHLAGASSVGASWNSPVETFSVNTTGSLNVFMSHLQYAPEARFIFAGSAEEYGRSSETPFRENDICTPSNPYALSKYSAAEAMNILAAKNNTRFIHLRLANHYGPGQRSGFVTADFASQIAAMENSPAAEIKVGNLEPMRDFLYVGDVVDAYMKIIEKPTFASGTYNIGTGKPIRIREILDTLLEISQIRAEIVVDPEKFRTADINKMSLDSTKFAKEFNWHPSVPLKDGLRLTYEAIKNGTSR